MTEHPMTYKLAYWTSQLTVLLKVVNFQFQGSRFQPLILNIDA